MEEEPLTLNFIIQYIRENAVGLLMFLSVFLIIYCVDHINRFNTLLYSMPSTIPGIPLNNQIINKKSKKFKK